MGVEVVLETSKVANKRLRESMKAAPSNDVGGGGGVSKSSASASSDEGGSDDAERNQMLELTLNMLRCSVCHDRFKEVAITRCFHLFCKPCIDMNLSSRHRKCPACGEKFGQDDVKSVFFTH